MGTQLALVLDTSLAARINEAGRRGLDVDAEVAERDRRLVGEIGGLIAGLNHALLAASVAGVDVVLVARYSDVPRPEAKRCVLRGRMRRLALDALV